MKKIKLKFQLTKFDKGLSFQILEQAEEFLNTDEKIRQSFKYSSNLTLVSEHITQFKLNDMELHLWGSSQDRRSVITSTDFLSNDARDEWHDYILETIEDWANNYDLFQEQNGGEYQKCKRLEGDIYEV